MQSFKRDTHSDSVSGSQFQKLLIIYFCFRGPTIGSHSQTTIFAKYDLEMSHWECPIGTYRTYGGVMWELLMFMQQARNFNFTIIPPMDSNAWGGYCFDDNNCTGMAGMVNRQEADFALGKI